MGGFLSPPVAMSRPRGGRSGWSARLCLTTRFWQLRHRMQEVAIEYPIVTMGIHMQDIHQVISNPIFIPIIMKSQRERLNSSQHDRQGRTTYVPTILTKLMIHQDCEKSRTREREREIKHIATSTYPQPRG